MKIQNNSLPSKLIYVLQSFTEVSSWEEAATEQTQMSGFHIPQNLQDFLLV